MLRNLLLLVSVTLLFWLAVELMRDRQTPPVSSSVAPAPQFDLEPIVPPPAAGGRNLVADINVHSLEELEALLERVEQLLDRPRKPDEEPLITLVLHGPEVEFFVLSNYNTYKSVVDRAAKLAALGAVDMAICQTQMTSRGIASDEIPSFLRQVPYGPGEVDRLLREGYVYM
jgi:intracellular sulfur oxidation DsrE/DsrF family protein